MHLQHALCASRCEIALLTSGLVLSRRHWAYISPSRQLVGVVEASLKVRMLFRSEPLMIARLLLPRSGIVDPRCGVSIVDQARNRLGRSLCDLQKHQLSVVFHFLFIFNQCFNLWGFGVLGFWG